MKETNNIILFPGMLQTLETESFAAIDEQDFETALEKLDILLAHQVSSYQIHIGKLICLIKLRKLSEAEQFCESLLSERADHHYYDYFEYYLMILYERNKFNELMTAIDEEGSMGDIPDEYNTKYEQLYEICYQINETTAHEILADLKVAITENNNQKQWYLMNKWKQLNVKPPEPLFTFLQEEKVHPVVKTKILETLQDNKINQEVKITKFGETLTIRPYELPKMDEHPIFQKTLEQISDIEQENPTLFELVKELHYQYNYVRYPFFFPQVDVDYVAQALVHLGKLHLSLHSTLNSECEKINGYIENIQVCNELYLKIILQ